MEGWVDVWMCGCVDVWMGGCVDGPIHSIFFYQSSNFQYSRRRFLDSSFTYIDIYIHIHTCFARRERP